MFHPQTNSPSLSPIWQLWLALFCLTVSGSFCSLHAISAPGTSESFRLEVTASDDPVGTFWWTPEMGWPRALKLRQPILLVIEAPGDQAPILTLDEQLLTRSTARLMEKVVAVRVLLREVDGGGWQWPAEADPPAPQKSSERWSRSQVRIPIEKMFGKPDGDSKIAILDLLGRKRAQLEGDKISGSALRKALKLAARECSVLSRKMTQESRLVDKATLLLQRGQTADCCRQLEEAQKLKVPAEAPPEKRRIEVLGLLEKQWREAMAKAKELERKNRLGEAASAYEKILKDFPHDPWEKEIRQEIGRVWRRIQGPGGGL